ncbi:MAG: class I SAM-dependent methyltransferase [Treponema sp.]|nr:class I SAM-dependent methyltransferase [Treponema sp.]
MENNNRVLQYYENANEDERILRHPIEFIRTKEIISRYLPEKQIKILDTCGASGHYAYWLAEKGHEVHLMDLSPKHIITAKNNRQKYKASLASIKIGDARSLEYENESFNMVLLMGALYHLQEKSDRILCLKEANRILKPGGIGIFAYISRCAIILDGFRKDYVNDPAEKELIDIDFLNGKHDSKLDKVGYFPNKYLHSTQEIYDELLSTTYCDITIYGIEGFSELIDQRKYLEDDTKLKTLLHYLRLIEQDKEIMGISDHKLVICKKIK